MWICFVFLNNEGISRRKVQDPSKCYVVSGHVSFAIILAWKIPWTEEPGGLWSIVSQRVGHDGSNLVLHHITRFFCRLFCKPSSETVALGPVPSGVCASGTTVSEGSLFVCLQVPHVSISTSVCSGRGGVQTEHGTHKCLCCPQD